MFRSDAEFAPMLAHVVVTWSIFTYLSTLLATVSILLFCHLKLYDGSLSHDLHAGGFPVLLRINRYESLIITCVLK